jgi:regulation of enolase protein 1 (concanavalin A-like superfamily)
VNTTGTYAQIALTAANIVSFVDPTLSASTTYCYRVRAYNSGGNSAYSNEVCVTTPVPKFRLSASLMGNGTLTGTPAGINCPTDCTEDYVAGTQVTLTPSPLSGATFASWGGDCTGQGSTCVVTMSATQNVAATFQPQTGGTLPSPWVNRDIGGVAAAGSASYANGTFTVNASGADIWGTADEFRYVYRQLSGNGVITARVSSLTNTNSWAKAGVMIRETLNANSKHATTVITPGQGVSFQRRTSTGGTSASTTRASVTIPEWVRLERNGTTFTAWHSDNGTSWTQIGSATISMGTTVYVGLAATSHSDGVVTTAKFDNVRAPN